LTSDNRNLLLAIVLMTIVLFGWPLIAERFLMPAQPQAPAPASGPTSAPASQPASQGATPQAPAAPSTVPEAGATAAPKTLQEAITGPRVAIRTPHLQGSINLVGARIDDLELLDHRQSLGADAPPVRLFAPSGLPQGYFAGFGWTGPGAPPADAVWTADSGMLAPDKPVTLSWQSPEGATFRIRLAIEDNYLLSVSQMVENGTEAALAVRPYGFVNRTGTGPETDAFNLHVGPIAVIDGTLKEGDISFEKLRDRGAQSFTTTGGWLGITDKYWLAALIPDQSQQVETRFQWSQAGDRYQTDFVAPAQQVAPGASATATSHLYAGAKEVELINRAAAKIGIPLFDRAIAWGWFWFIAQPIFWMLDQFYKLFGNWGLAIIGLTIVVRIILFPIANKQYASMAKMKVFAPKIKEIQEKYKDDKVRQQQEIMEIYKKEKINPLAGCLPILLQIPIFYALYKTILIAIEIRHQPLAAWIKDLSAPDPLTPLNLFGLLPFDPPGFLAIGILPIILGITMWLQFRLNPAPMDDIQKTVFAWMPWIFMFVMAPFAAGLQLYWIINNIISIGQQWLLNRKYAAPAPAPAAGK
jgi:YidC/Oxa1 family membrane protein insertase